MYYVLEIANSGLIVGQKPIGFVKGLHHSKWKALDQRGQLEQDKVKGSVMGYVIVSVTDGNQRYDLRA
jgi:hypothetical protein